MCDKIPRCTTGTHANVYVPYTQIISWAVSPSDCKCAHVCHCRSHAFFISSPRWCVTIEIRQWWQRCRGGGRKKGVWNWTGNYVLQLRHGGDIKSYTPVPGDKMQEGGDAMEGDSSIRIPGFLIEPGGGGKQGRETGRLCLIMYLELV